MRYLRSVYKPHFVRDLRRFTPRRLRPCRLDSVIIYLCSLPETRKERAAPLSLLDLAPDGGCLAAHITVNAGGLLHHLFTLTAVPRRALMRLLVSVARSDRLLHPGVSPAPCPVEYGLSSTQRKAEPRSPNRPEAPSSYNGEDEASTL